MAICLARHVIRQTRNAPWMKRCGSPGKASHGEIKTAPKEMDRTDFSNVSGTKMMKYAIYAHEGIEETFHGLGIVRPWLAVIAKWDRVRDFVWPTVELGCAA